MEQWMQMNRKKNMEPQQEETKEKEDNRGTKMLHQKYRGGDKCKRVS